MSWMWRTLAKPGRSGLLCFGLWRAAVQVHEGHNLLSVGICMSLEVYYSIFLGLQFIE